MVEQGSATPAPSPRRSGALTERGHAVVGRCSARQALGREGDACSKAKPSKPGRQNGAGRGEWRLGGPL